MKFLLPILLATALATPSFAQTQYTLNIDAPASAAQWSGNTSLGVLKGNKNLNITGTVDVKLDSATAPFGGGEFNGGSIGTDPTEIYAYVENPLPFLPPLAKIWIRDLDLLLFSNHFSISSSGTYITDTWMYVNNGEIEVEALGSTTFTNLAGTTTDPVSVNGDFTESAGMVYLHNAINLYISNTISGISFDFSLVGDMYADAPVSNPPGMDLSITTLIAGASATFAVTNGNANAKAYVAYSVRGPGSTTIPGLGITLDIRNPKLLFSGNADSTGAISWSTTVPQFPGLTVWFQACGMGITSNVISQTIL